ncbi:transposable element Tc3 transposase [Trichonephila clavipes]|nr:transposable element Tc3 transposase [Trichonephila clavipes]
MLGSRTDLHIFDARSFNGTRYCNEILLPYVRLFRSAMGLQFLFMDDNAPCHRPVAAKTALRDFIPISSLWIKIFVYIELIWLNNFWKAHRAHLVDGFLESEDIRRIYRLVRSSDLIRVEHSLDWTFCGGSKRFHQRYNQEPPYSKGIKCFKNQNVCAKENVAESHVFQRKLLTDFAARKNEVRENWRYAGIMELEMPQSTVWCSSPVTNRGCNFSPSINSTLSISNAASMVTQSKKDSVPGLERGPVLELALTEGAEIVALQETKLKAHSLPSRLRDTISLG